ncbi:MAG: RluA family pseudouridine synthase [Thermoanaerobaculia bacterium]|nr:RluA family pseudouridine synthase [Thermoanaerobaculia bacterium]
MDILFEDNDLLAVNKPAGLSTESGRAPHPSAEKEALQYLLEREQAAPARLPAHKTPYLRAVHRLDRAASGVLLLAKSKTALSNLMNQFERQTVEKVYIAEVEPAPGEASGILRHFLKRSPDGKSALVSDLETPDSRPVELRYRVLENPGKNNRLEIFPASGRFHQIRAQLAHIGCPITGDVRYGGPFWREHAIKLHARRLVIRHPKSGAQLVIEAPLPPEW